jgi:hypothetical protein
MIETKEVKITRFSEDGKKDSLKYVDDLLAFGWQKTQMATRREGRTENDYQILARETTISHYEEYVKLEADYEKFRSKKKVYYSIEFETLLLLLVILIIPGIIYLIYNSTEKSDIEKNNRFCEQEMRKIIDEAKNLK